MALGPYLTGSALTVLGALLAAFLLQLLVLSPVQHAQAQRVSYASLRSELAQAIAPVGQVDGDSRVLALGSPVALLEIPALGLREVVGEGTTAGVLTAGPGHERDSVLPGQAGTSVIFGRRAAYGGPFRHLEQLRPGDRITVQTGLGSHTYAVLGVRRGGDPQPLALSGSSGRLTLVTATGPAYRPTGVLRVDAELTSPAQAHLVPVIPVGGVPAAERALAGDQSEWLAVMLWGQLLVVLTLLLVWVRSRWGRWQSWIVAVPVLGAVGVQVADHVSRLLPNLL
ncbi:MAG: hypothetical protein JWN95_1885 [Frankiales bacterium]|nr:hypothetical protein [Frankiales bacterium]